MTVSASDRVTVSASDPVTASASDPLTAPPANLVEIFWSVQGEGPHVGRSTVFVRFGECDLRCRWCDSPRTWRPARSCRIEQPGGADERVVQNPVGQATIAEAIRALAPAPGSFVSLTGGEPLLQPEACAGVAASAHVLGLRVYLETHGLAVEALERVIERVDVVSMDWKLRSDVAPAEASADSDFAPRHRRFLAVATRAPEHYVKVVISDATRDEELDEVTRAIAEIAPATPLVLQPVTPFGPVKTRPAAARLLALHRRAEAVLADVRLIPQTHPIYGAR